MEIIKAEKKDKAIVLQLLDEFRTECLRIISPLETTIFKTATELGQSIFDQVIASKTSAIFIAIFKNEPIGVLTIHKIPRVRRADYCAEIEEMYLKPTFQGNNVANDLLTAAINWARENSITTIRLESNNSLKRAHSFYEKNGFVNYGMAYELTI
jgi:GNAT superfamily N-acetyltransferase